MRTILVILLASAAAFAQGPSPESAAPIFPGGGLISANYIKDSSRREVPFTFSWGFRRDFQFSAVVRDGPMFLLKYRFLRLDSERGTTQAAITAGPAISTGHRSGPNDLFLNLAWTYTGLFHIKKLVADLSADYLVRSSAKNIRLFVPYRPYQQKGLGKEWWIGPTLTLQNKFSVGATTYFSPSPGLIFWAGGEQHRVSIGVTRQFAIHR